MDLGEALAPREGTGHITLDVDGRRLPLGEPLRVGEEGVDRIRRAVEVATGALVDELVAGDRDTIGLRLATYLLTTLETESARSVFLARVRGAATEPEAAALVRDRIAQEVVGPLVRRLGSDRPELRAGLTSSQLFGWIVACWLVEIEALRHLSSPEAAALIGPVLQRYLVEPLEG